MHGGLIETYTIVFEMKREYSIGLVFHIYEYKLQHSTVHTVAIQSQLLLSLSLYDISSVTLS